MRRPHSDPLLTTGQVAKRCGTNEETIRYFAQTGVLRGHLSGGEWGFFLADAQPFCDDWRNQKARLWAAGTSGTPRQSPVRRVGGFGVGFLNFSASVVSIATAIGLDSNESIGFALAALNLLLVAAHTVWSAVRRRAHEAALESGRVDPDAVAWRTGEGGLPLLRGLQTACLLATVGYVAVSALPLLTPPRQEGQGPAPPLTATRTATFQVSPTPVNTVPPVFIGTTPEGGGGIETAVRELEEAIEAESEGPVNQPTPTTPPPPDPDGDDVPNDGTDNCPDVPNADQTDTDGNGAGDACDPVPIRPLLPTVEESEAGDPGGPDRDGDTVPDAIDNCPDNQNRDQANDDGVGFGDACEGPE